MNRLNEADISCVPPASLYTPSRVTGLTSRLSICFIVKLIKSSLSQETHIVKDIKDM